MASLAILGIIIFSFLSLIKPQNSLCNNEISFRKSHEIRDNGVLF